jgi:hypothetical protein
MTNETELKPLKDELNINIVYIIVYDNIFDSHISGNVILADNYIYSTREIAQKHWRQLGASRFGFSIKEMELIKE